MDVIVGSRKLVVAALVLVTLSLALPAAAAPGGLGWSEAGRSSLLLDVFSVIGSWFEDVFVSAASPPQHLAEKGGATTTTTGGTGGSSGGTTGGSSGGGSAGPGAMVDGLP